MHMADCDIALRRDKRGDKKSHVALQNVVANDSTAGGKAPVVV
jgi:hypothetical protein